MAKSTVSYRAILNVTLGVKAQIEACLNALDLHDKLPDEAEDLGTSLAKAHKLCEKIVANAESEPEPNEETPHLNPDAIGKGVEQPAVN